MDRDTLHQVITNSIEQHRLDPQKRTPADVDIDAVAVEITDISGDREFQELDPVEFWKIVDKHSRQG